jgi:TonB family protein
VFVQAYFDENGNVTVLRVVKGLGYGLDENALAAIKAWRFAPALSNGLPVSAVADIEVPFRLVLTHIRIITADTQVLVNDAVHLKGNVEVRVTRNDGSVWMIKGNMVIYRPDQVETQGDARVAIEKVQ